MFVDQVTIIVQSGDGGPGSVSFRREKFVPKGGPDGGNGGNGGNVVLRANAQLHTLLDQRYRRNYEAQTGAKGQASRKFGKWGEHLVVFVPCGTIVKDAQSEEILVDLVEDGQEYVVAKGGKGGRGNAEFATSVKQTPRYAEPGWPGEVKELLLELKLLADVGLVGFPNAGKSTLISVLSAARPKIADYPFTTLEPNLGIVSYYEYKSFTVADIPGLIEGAHEGKGLGIKFLKHIERTKVLVILIDCMSDSYEEEYRVLRSELESFSRDLSRKPYIIAMSKLDVADEEVTEKIRAFEKTLDTAVLKFSSVARTGLSELKDSMWEMLQQANDEK